MITIITIEQYLTPKGTQIQYKIGFFLSEIHNLNW